MSASIFAADITIKGEVVDVACSMSKGEGGHGDGHAACAMSCAKRGQPVGILTDDAIYEVTGEWAADKNAKLLDFVAKQVEVTGEVTEKDGKKMLAVKSIKLAN
jgi:GR25 family glycosyltransferase involved in LPS biosynthesis